MCTGIMSLVALAGDLLASEKLFLPTFRANFSSNDPKPVGSLDASSNGKRRTGAGNSCSL